MMKGNLRSRYPRRLVRRAVGLPGRAGRLWRLVAGVGAVVVTATGLIAFAEGADGPLGPVVSGAGPVAPAAPSGAGATVVRVVDGDTVVVEEAGSEVTVRILGVDTPETKHPSRPVECFGPEAAAHLEQLLPPGAAVLLGEDSLQPGTDRYGRALRHVFVQDQTSTEAVLVSLELVAGGWGVRYTGAATDYDEELLRAEGFARQAGAGLWSACPTGS